MKLLLEHRDAVLARNEATRLRILSQLREFSRIHLKGCRLWVYGSLSQKGRFRQESDIDLALDLEPEGMSIYGISAWLGEILGRPTDVVILSETRFKDAIEKKGISWIA